MGEFILWRNGIFEDLKVSLHHYLYGLGAAEKVARMDWFDQVTNEPVLVNLIDKYLELEFARFMKLYGAKQLHHDLLEPFLMLIRAIHNYRLKPLLAVLKEYDTVYLEEAKAK